MATKTKRSKKVAPKPAPGPLYFELVRRFPLRPITSEAELDQAIAMTDQLAPRQDLSSDEEDYLEALAMFISAYEDEHHAIDDNVSPREFLRMLLEESGTTPYRLAKETGISNATLSEILSGKSNISPRVRKILADRFKVKESAFV